jgi:hypothetical protein
MSYLMHMQFIVTFCFNYLLLLLLIIIFCFTNIGTYVGDEPPQQDEEIEEAKEKPTIHRPHMPCNQDKRV